MLLLLLEHHSRVLALMGKLLRVRRRRRLAEVPAAAGRGCHHGDVDWGLPLFLFLTATMRNGLCTIGKSLPYFYYVSLPIGQHEDETLSRRFNGPRATREEGSFV